MRIYAEVEKKRLGNKEKRQEISLAAGIALPSSLKYKVYLEVGL